MLVFGDEKECFTQALYGGFRIFNISNLIEQGIRLNCLIPPGLISEDKDFDMYYANFIMQNDNAFVELMNVMYNLYEGNLVYILIDYSDYKNLLTESLIKFIQQRYGYNAYIVNTLEDFDHVRASEFSLSGVFNLDLDKKRFADLVFGQTDIGDVYSE